MGFGGPMSGGPGLDPVLCQLNKTVFLRWAITSRDKKFNSHIESQIYSAALAQEIKKSCEAIK